MDTGNWRSIALADSHVCGVHTDGSLWCRGLNDHGELGVASVPSKVFSSFVQVGTDSDWTQVSTSDQVTCALKNDGSLWCWGLDDSTVEQVGSSHDWVRVAALNGGLCATRGDGSVHCLSPLVGTPPPVFEVSDSKLSTFEAP